MNKAKINRVKQLVESTKGKFFTVEFTKANGEPRKMNARTGVTKHLKGGEATYQGRDGDKPNIGVYEHGSGSYKCFNAERVTKLVIDKTEIVFKN